ncbi:unnamed protein product, partial [Cyprideis torosa]
MTIPEACQLVQEAGAMGKGGEIFIFDMGESVKIYDLAKKMIRLSGLRFPEDIDIQIVGLRPGEKIYEELLADGYISFPVIGRVKLAGLSREEAASVLEGKLSYYLKNPTVTMRIKNMKFTVLGEVNKPGAYTINGERVTLLEALGMAGDLKLTGDTQDPKELIQKMPKQNLDILNAGPIPPNPTELIGNGRFNELLDKLENEYDYILIDTAPMQREIGQKGGVVMDGRDIGTTVFPHADVKIFLRANAKERAERRYKELIENGHQVELQKVIENIEERDFLDATRTVSPLTQADDALVIDNTKLSKDETFEKALSLILAKANSIEK